MKNYLSAAKLNRMKNGYQYQNLNKSLVEKKLEGAYNKLLALIPKRIAPNLITLVSLLQFTFVTVLVMYTSGGGKVAPPGWVCVLAGISHLVWHVLDMLDGRQARKTGNVTHVGEFWDHSCDNFILTMSRYCMLAIFGSSHYMWTIAGLFVHWIEQIRYATQYSSGTYYTPFFGGPECQIIFAIMFIATGVVGPSKWKTLVKTQVKSAGNSYGYYLLHYVIMLAFILKLIEVIIRFARTPTATNNGLGTVAGTHILSPLVALAIAHSCVYVTGTAANFTNWYYVITLDLISVKLCNSIIVNCMTISRCNKVDSVHLYLGLFTLNHMWPVIARDPALIIMLLCTTVDVLWHWLGVCKELANFLDINMFSIPLPVVENTTDPVVEDRAPTPTPISSNPSTHTD